MILVTILQAALVGWLVSAPTSASTPDPLARIEEAQQALFERLAPAVVFINTAEGFGSGFIVSHDGLVLTNAHVVGKQKTVDVVMHDGRRLSATVSHKAKGVDLALVQLPLSKTTPIPLGDSDRLRVGAWVGAIGHGHGGIWTFNTGMVSNIYPVASDRPVFQTQIPLNPGASGGPIFDRTGAVMGVVTAGILDAEAINFGIKIDVALTVLKPLAARCDCLTVIGPAGAPLFVDGEMRGQGPRVVIPITRGTHEVLAVVNGERRLERIEFPKQREVKLVAEGAQE